MAPKQAVEGANWGIKREKEKKKIFIIKKVKTWLRRVVD